MSLSFLATTTPSPISGNPLRKAKFRPSVGRVAYTSCEQKQSNKEDGETSHVIDRRNVLLGLGGLYGATTTLGLNKQGMMAIASPVQPPDLSKCHLATDDTNNEQIKCCPPYSTANIIDFVPPSHKEPLRVRHAAHKLDDEYIAKFKAGIAKMKALPADDPWNYNQQATIHCTYCNGAFDQVGFDPAVLLQVHGSYLFLPWHRYYLYFYERIIGKLIDDPTFALPFWNWDTQEGMRMPPIYYSDTSSPLYDDLRNKDHYTALLDLSYSPGDPNPTSDKAEDVIIQNLKTVQTVFSQENLSSPALFMGKPVSAGVVATDSTGSLENLHAILHMWTGTTEVPYYDMGNFSTAARDLLFFAHHGNIDRMWDIYSTFRGHKPEFTDTDFLEASFIFYDENRQVVKCKVENCLTPQQLRYSYQPEKLPWSDVQRRYTRWKAANKKPAGESISLKPVSEFGSKPRPLTEPINAIVSRPKISRTKDEKADEVEVLVIENIEVPHGIAARFDIYVTKPVEGLVGPDKGEIAGSFVKIPHSHTKKSKGANGPKSNLQLGITTLLEDIGAEASDKLVVTLVPRSGAFTIGGIHIELSKVDEN